MKLQTAMIFLTALGLTAATSNFDEEIARASLSYSSASYCSRKTISDWSCGKACQYNPNITDVTTFIDDETNTFGYTAYDPVRNHIVVAFRGTLGLDYKNWVTNLRFNLEPYKHYPYAEVHVGFYNAYEAVSS